MSMFSTDPMATSKFRENTAKDKNHGITMGTFMCRRCLTPKGLKGRKRVNSDPKSGWMCAHCDEIREAKRSIKLSGN